MAQNIEIKARIPSSAALQQRILELGHTKSAVLHQVDTFFPCSNGRLKLRQFDDGSAELIAYHRSNQASLRHSTYERTELSDGDGMLRALTASLGVRGIIKKRRDLFLVGPTRIHVDQVESLGDFMEIEVVLSPEVQDSEGARIGAEWLTQLGIEPEAQLAEAYIDLLLAKA